MPLRDHFRPPVGNQVSWEGFHALWPGMMVLQLNQNLPDDFAVEPRVRLSSSREVVGTDRESTEPYEYEVLIYDRSRGRELVAAVEIVSPAHKDRPESRQAFVAKCAALLQKRVCVSIVDLVTTRKFNLYGELMDLAGRPVPEFVATAPATYAATCRGRRVNDRPRFEVWAYPLVVGEPLPTLPIWLRDDCPIALDLEASYEETCRALRLR